MRLFRKSLSKPECDAVLELIRHLQSMYAYQQLTMERYNDALVGAGMAKPGSELSHRSAAGLITASTVEECVIPAVSLKQDVLLQMQKAHDDFGRPTFRSMHSAYDDGSHFLGAMRARADAQRAGWMAWLADSRATSVGTRDLDRAERQALDRSIRSLNSLIKTIGLKPDAWLDLNCDAFNTVRSWAGLDPLVGADFRTRFFAGQVTGSARFFDA